MIGAFGDLMALTNMCMGVALYLAWRCLASSMLNITQAKTSLPRLAQFAGVRTLVATPCCVQTMQTVFQGALRLS